MLNFPKVMLLAIVNTAGYYWKECFTFILIFCVKYFSFYIGINYSWVQIICNKDLENFSVLKNKMAVYSSVLTLNFIFSILSYYLQNP